MIAEVAGESNQQQYPLAIPLDTRASETGQDTQRCGFLLNTLCGIGKNVRRTADIQWNMVGHIYCES